MSKTATTTSTKRAALLSDMTPALQKVALDFEGKGKKKARMLCLSEYDKGTKIREVIEEEAQYGSNAVEQLAAYLGQKATKLYNLRNFVSSFTREVVEEMASQPMTSGRHIEPAHFFAMMKVKDGRTVNKLWKKVMTLSWSSAQLETEISATTDTKNDRSGGRKPQRPVSAAAGLESIRLDAQKVNNLIPVICEASCDAIDEMAPADIDAKLLKALISARTTVTALYEATEVILGRLEDNIERAERVLETKGSETAEEEDEFEEEEDVVVEEVDEDEEDDDDDDEEDFAEFEEDATDRQSTGKKKSKKTKVTKDTATTTS